MELRGLTTAQAVLADILWNCDTAEDCQQMIAALPEPYRQEARAVHALMKCAAFDTVEEVTADVQAFIAGCMRK